jgi:hypothetical protein
VKDGERLGDLLALEGGELVARRPHVAWLTVENGECKLTQMKVAAEVAAAEFDRLCGAMRIETDLAELDEHELEAWNGLRDPIIKDIQRGQLVISTDGLAVYTPTGGKALTFNPPTGATLMALETHGKGKDVSNMVAAIADMTGVGKGEFSRLAARDVQACGRLARLFLADQ